VTGVQSDLPEPRHVGAGVIRRWLVLGWRDFRATWRAGLVHGLALVAGAAAILAIGWQRSWLLAGAFSGFVLLAPALLTGLYELSRLRERGRRPSLDDAAKAWQRGGGRTLALGVLMAGIGTAWVMWSATIVLAMHGEEAPGVSGFVSQFLAPDNGLLLALWFASGGMLAALVFGLTAFSIPMILDRPQGVRVALLSSVRTVGANPTVMALWAGVIMALTLLAFLTVIGLVILVPVLAHSSWHAYRDCVNEH
jgi:uncharacterized membrane protein